MRTCSLFVSSAMVLLLLPIIHGSLSRCEHLEFIGFSLSSLSILTAFKTHPYFLIFVTRHIIFLWGTAPTDKDSAPPAVMFTPENTENLTTNLTSLRFLIWDPFLRFLRVALINYEYILIHSTTGY